MHKGIELLNPDVEKQHYGDNELMVGLPFSEGKPVKKNIVFLDIDGVIQPYDSRFRFAHSCDLTMEKLRKEYIRNLWMRVTAGIFLLHIMTGMRLHWPGLQSFADTAVRTLFCIHPG